MKRVMMHQCRMPNDDLLTYYLLSHPPFYGVEISLSVNGSAVDQSGTPLCLSKEAAVRLLSVFSDHTVYPVHLPELLRDFDFSSIL